MTGLGWYLDFLQLKINLSITLLEWFLSTFFSDGYLHHPKNPFWNYQSLLSGVMVLWSTNCVTLGRRSVARKKIDSAKRKWQNTAAVLDPKPLTLSKLFLRLFLFNKIYWMKMLELELCLQKFAPFGETRYRLEGKFQYFPSNRVPIIF